MRARDLANPFPSVGLSTPAIEAAQLLAGQDLPGLIVVDGQGRPFTVLPGTQVLRMAVPQYILDDPTLARVIDEAAADVFLRGLGERTVAQCLPSERRELPVVEPDATVLEIAALMARSRSPLVAVFARDEGLLGAVTLDALLDRLWPHGQRQRRRAGLPGAVVVVGARRKPGRQRHRRRRVGERRRARHSRTGRTPHLVLGVHQVRLVVTVVTIALCVPYLWLRYFVFAG